MAQIVGTHGKVITLSSDDNILNICKARVKRWSPRAKIMNWKLLESVTQPRVILEAFIGEKFDAIIYCGAISAFPIEMEELLSVGGSLVAPVEVADNQQFRLLIRRSATATELLTISDFGGLFEPVK